MNVQIENQWQIQSVVNLWTTEAHTGVYFPAYFSFYIFKPETRWNTLYFSRYVQFLWHLTSDSSQDKATGLIAFASIILNIYYPHHWCIVAAVYTIYRIQFSCSLKYTRTAPPSPQPLPPRGKINVANIRKSHDTLSEVANLIDCEIYCCSLPPHRIYILQLPILQHYGCVPSPKTVVQQLAHRHIFMYS